MPRGRRDEFRPTNRTNLRGDAAKITGGRIHLHHHHVTQLRFGGVVASIFEIDFGSSVLNVFDHFFFNQNVNSGTRTVEIDIRLDTLRLPYPRVASIGGDQRGTKCFKHCIAR